MINSSEIVEESIVTDQPDRLALGIDVGGTNIQAGVIDQSGNVLGRAKVKTEVAEGYETVMDRVAAAARQACEKAGVVISKINAAGLGVPGPVDPQRGVVAEAVNLRWNNEPVAESLSERLSLPVHADNDVNVAVYGEWAAGAGVGASDMLGVWVGTGVGSGLILNGQLRRGVHHSAGEIGHMVFLPGAPHGSRTIEQNCSRTAIAHQLVKLVRANHESIISGLTNGKLSRVKSKPLAIAYEQRDELVCTIIDDAADRLGTAIAGIATLLSLDRVVLGGGLVEAIGKPYVEIVRDACRREIFPASLRSIEVEKSKLGDDAGVVGAGLLALHTEYSEIE
jgi:glucokinase